MRHQCCVVLDLDCDRGCGLYDEHQSLYKGDLEDFCFVTFGNTFGDER